LAQTTCGGDATGPGKTTVGADGGTASLAKGAVTLLIPSGALATEVEFSATQTSSAPESYLIVPGSTWEIGPPGTTFTKPVTVTLRYDPGNLPEGIREVELGLYRAFGANWQLALNPSVDTDAHTVSGRVMSLGTFGARGLSVKTVEVSPTSYTLEQGQTKALTAVGKAASGMALPERLIAWTSSDESVATVDAEGLVTAVGVGSATIRGTVEGNAGSAEINTWNCAWQTEVPETECQALIDFYDAGNEEDWRYSKSWVPTPHPCDWRGVTCDGGSVSRLVLRGLTGSIPFSVGDLSNLTELDLYMNQLTGPIPNSLGNLSNLRRLDLSSNNLTGPIPSELGNLSNLTELWLYWNALSGPIPPELGRLSNLADLRLNGNQLSGQIPPELGALSNLLRMSLLENQLSGAIPPELGDLSSLQSLSLGVSPLSGSIPPELGKLSNLTSLGISRTEISGPIPAELGNLVNLDAMFLLGNQLSGQIPLPVAQLGGLVQAKDGGGPQCVFTPPGNPDLSMPDTQEYRDADLNGDGKICGVTIGGG
jgi:hypothetical protein